jgi:hypothetical protein
LQNDVQYLRCLNYLFYVKGLVKFFYASIELGNCFTGYAYPTDAAFENGRYRLEAEKTVQFWELEPLTVEYFVYDQFNLERLELVLLILGVSLDKALDSFEDLETYSFFVFFRLVLSLS